MVITLLQVVTLYLRLEHGHQLLLLLDLEMLEAKSDILQIGHQNYQKFEGRIH